MKGSRKKLSCIINCSNKNKWKYDRCRYRDFAGELQRVLARAVSILERSGSVTIDNGVSLRKQFGKSLVKKISVTSDLSEPVQKSGQLRLSKSWPGRSKAELSVVSEG
ncbi:MAG: hypothetical protein ACLR1D_00035 [Dialister sp.]